jgi:hypothetical protein
MSTERRLSQAFLRVALLWAPLVSAASGDGLDFEFHGFATQGFVKTDSNSFFGDSENGSFDFREIGVNLAVEPTPRLRLSGQLLSRKAGGMYSGRPEVDFAVADYTLASSESSSVRVLLGRIKHPLGLYNETRDIAFTRPGVFVPQEVYFDKVRNLVLSSDGVATKFGWFGDQLDLNLHLAASRMRVDDNVESSYLGGLWQGELEPEDVSFVGSLTASTPNERLKAGFSMVSTNLDFEPGPADPIGPGNIDILFLLASLQYAVGDWTLSAEYMREPISWNGFAGFILADHEATSEGYYAQAEWHLNDRFSLLFRYGELYADRNDRSGRALEMASGGFVPGHVAYSHIATLGARWDLSPQLMLQAEVQRHNGTFVLSNRENPQPAMTDPDWTLFALSLSYRF